MFTIAFGLAVRTVTFLLAAFGSIVRWAVLAERYYWYLNQEKVRTSSLNIKLPMAPPSSAPLVFPDDHSALNGELSKCGADSCLPARFGVPRVSTMVFYGLASSLPSAWCRYARPLSASLYKTCCTIGASGRPRPLASTSCKRVVWLLRPPRLGAPQTRKARRRSDWTSHSG